MCQPRLTKRHRERGERESVVVSVLSRPDLPRTGCTAAVVARGRDAEEDRGGDDAGQRDEHQPRRRIGSLRLRRATLLELLAAAAATLFVPADLPMRHGHYPRGLWLLGLDSNQQPSG